MIYKLFSSSVMHFNNIKVLSINPNILTPPKQFYANVILVGYV